MGLTDRVIHLCPTRPSLMEKLSQYAKRGQHKTRHVLAWKYCPNIVIVLFIGDLITASLCLLAEVPFRDHHTKFSAFQNWFGNTSITH